MIVNLWVCMLIIVKFWIRNWWSWRNVGKMLYRLILGLLCWSDIVFYVIPMRILNNRYRYLNNSFSYIHNNQPSNPNANPIPNSLNLSLTNLLLLMYIHPLLPNHKINSFSNWLSSTWCCTNSIWILSFIERSWNICSISWMF